MPLNWARRTSPRSGRQTYGAEDFKLSTTLTQCGATSIFLRTDDIPACAVTVPTRATSIFGRAEDILVGTEDILTGTTSIIGRAEDILVGAEGIITGTTSILLSEIET